VDPYGEDVNSAKSDRTLHACFRSLDGNVHAFDASADPALLLWLVTEALRAHPFCASMGAWEK